MTRNTQRDEVYYHRLSSFLNKSGGLIVKRFIKIKPMVFKIEAKSGEFYLLKGHFHPIRIKQQWDFFECIKDRGHQEVLVPFVHFPNGSKTIADSRVTWTISPYIHGRTLKYTNKSDRQKALDTLRAFHACANNIQINEHLETKNLFERMKKRFIRFKQSDKMFQDYGKQRLFKEICTLSEYLLQTTSSYPWQEKMNQAKHNGQWIHGDVASHNFIHGETTTLIDFDLLSIAPQLYDYIQLGQRFLPYIDWRLDTLLSYEMVAAEDTALWLMMIGLPSDVMREWHIASNKKNIEMASYLQKMEEEWEQRKIFLRNAHSMLQSK